MQNLYSDTDIKELGLAFNAFDPKYINVVNNGYIERFYIKPLLNEFYDTFASDPNLYPTIADDIKRAVSFLVIDKAIARNGVSKTQNLGEITNFTRNSKKADNTDVNNKRDEFYTDAIMLLIDVAKELLGDPDSYTNFDASKTILEITFRNSTGLV